MEYKVNFAVPMRQIKKGIMTEEGLTIKDVFAGEGQSLTEMADIVVNGTPLADLEHGEDTRIGDVLDENEEVHLWGLVQSEGGEIK